MEDSSDVLLACSCLSGLIAFRIWRTQKQTNDAKMGSNLMQVSVIVIESGAFHLPRSRYDPGNFTRVRSIANRCDLSKRAGLCGRKFYDQVASLQHLFGYRKPVVPLLPLISANNVVACRRRP